MLFSFNFGTVFSTNKVKKRYIIDADGDIPIRVSLTLKSTSAGL